MLNVWLTDIKELKPGLYSVKCSTSVTESPLRRRRASWRMSASSPSPLDGVTDTFHAAGDDAEGLRKK